MRLAKKFLKVYLYGVLILLVAILANYLARVLGLLDWYSFLRSESFEGNFLDVIWLFVIYPLILGMSAKKIIKILKK